MRKIISLLIIILFFTCGGYAQSKPAASLTARDSMDILNQLMGMLDSSHTPVSYVFANIGVGNRLFSIKNYSLDARQSLTNVVICSPSIGYFHKSGLGLTAGAGLVNDATGLGVNQYSLSPSFDYNGNKNIAFGISYAHYFVINKFSQYSPPIQNDLYASFTYKRKWLQPGIAVGYASGDYKEAKHLDTPIAGIRKYYYDSVNYALKAFSVAATIGHQFLWSSFLDKSDLISFTSTLVANAGSGKTAIRHKTNAVALFNFLNKRGRIPKLQNNNFEMQSIALNLDLNCTVGNITFEPQVNFDYYLPATDLKRFTQVFVINIGYAF